MDLSADGPDVAYYLAGEAFESGAPELARVQISRAQAEGMVGGSVDVAYITGLDTATPLGVGFGGVPHLRDLYAPDWFYFYYDPDPGDAPAGFSFATCYDGGSEDTEVSLGGGASQFLFELVGPSANSYVALGFSGTPEEDYELRAFSGADGGQYISLDAPPGISPRHVGLTTVKVWRVDGFVPPAPPAQKFWTSFIGAKEIV